MKRIFIGGTGRSGTSIMRETLCRYPTIAGLPFEFRLHVVGGGLIDVAEALSRRWTRTGGNAALHRFRNLSFFFSTFGRIDGPLWWRLARSIGWSHDETVYSSRLWRLLDRRGWLLTHPHSRLNVAFGTKYFDAVSGLIDDFTFARASSRSADVPEPTEYSQGGSFHETRPWERREAYHRCGQFMDDLFTAAFDGTSVWCEDTPLNLLQTDQVQSLFGHGETFFIHMLRHPADVVASLYGHEGAGGWSPQTFEVTLSVIRALANSLERQHRKTDAPILPVKLEKFATSPTDTLHEIGDFTGLDLTPSMLPDLDLDAERPSKARELLTRTQRQRVWKAVGSYYKKFGYSESA